MATWGAYFKSYVHKGGAGTPFPSSNPTTSFSPTTTVTILNTPPKPPESIPTVKKSQLQHLQEKEQVGFQRSNSTAAKKLYEIPIVSAEDKTGQTEVLPLQGNTSNAARVAKLFGYATPAAVKVMDVMLKKGKNESSVGEPKMVEIVRSVMEREKYVGNSQVSQASLEPKAKEQVQQSMLSATRVEKLFGYPPEAKMGVKIQASQAVPVVSKNAKAVLTPATTTKTGTNRSTNTDIKVEVKRANPPQPRSKEDTLSMLDFFANQTWTAQSNEDLTSFKRMVPEGVGAVASDNTAAVSTSNFFSQTLTEEPEEDPDLLQKVVPKVSKTVVLEKTTAMSMLDDFASQTWTEEPPKDHQLLKEEITMAPKPVVADKSSAFSKLEFLAGQTWPAEFEEDSKLPTGVISSPKSIISPRTGVIKVSQDLV